MKALFPKGHVDGKPVTKLLVDGGATVNLMLYAMLRKFGKSEEDLAKTDMMLKDFEGNVSPVLGALCVDLTKFSLSRGRGHIIYCWVETGFMPIIAFLLRCTNASYNGLEIRWKWSMLIPLSVLL